MVLSESQKSKIIDDFENWRDVMYGNLSLAERQKLGAFFTPPSLTIQMIEKFEKLEGKIIDPTSGAGGLLIGCFYAGANIENLYGIELDKNILENVCWKRIDRIIDNDIEHNWTDEKKKQLKDLIRKHIHWGDALDKRCYSFDDDEKSEEYTEWVKEQDNIEKEKQKKKIDGMQANVAENVKGVPCFRNLLKA